jgi:hypothetical protein
MKSALVLWLFVMSQSLSYKNSFHGGENLALLRLNRHAMQATSNRHQDNNPIPLT